MSALVLPLPSCPCGHNINFEKSGFTPKSADVRIYRTTFPMSALDKSHPPECGRFMDGPLCDFKSRFIIIRLRLEPKALCVWNSTFLWWTIVLLYRLSFMQSWVVLFFISVFRNFPDFSSFSRRAYYTIKHAQDAIYLTAIRVKHTKLNVFLRITNNKF